MGGLATAAALRRVGIDVMVYEQAAQFTRIGAGIQVGCNAMKVLRGLGLEARLRGQSFYPRSWNNRDWQTGAVKFDMVFGERRSSARPICSRIAAISMRPWPARSPTYPSSSVTSSLVWMRPPTASG
jgi:2-polyprenyl-6-methoxyphenol hydroxylase-like FAD-dependent oxidoreductase